MNDTPTTPPAEPTCPRCHKGKMAIRNGLHVDCPFCNPQPRKEGGEAKCDTNSQLAECAPAETRNATLASVSSKAEQSSDPTVIGATLPKSPTPETDAAQFTCVVHGLSGTGSRAMHVLSSFARRLETERDTARVERDEARKVISDGLQNIVADAACESLFRQFTKATAENARLRETQERSFSSPLAQPEARLAQSSPPNPMNTPILTGKTPSGVPFRIARYSLQYEPHDGVGSVGVPLRHDCPLDRLHEELSTVGRVSEEMRRHFAN